MTTGIKIKAYKKEFDYSYTIGAYPTIELLKNKLHMVRELIVHSKFADISTVHAASDHIEITYNDKIFERVGVNDNSFILGVFSKYDMQLNADRPHIVLVNPSDMGNLGTIIRTVLGLGYKDIAIITPAADIWNPKTVRASMGAIFKMNIAFFRSFNAYKSQFLEHRLFPFMLGGDRKLTPETCPSISLFSLIFGNEATGLDAQFLSVGEAFQIPQTSEVDSLNLAVATAVGAYTFALKNQLL